MSYMVLARKWRPKKFSELVGQTHVMQALANGLDQQRLHHAYLFTGTRGVGKTTIARIFAKSLNCEQGVSSQPCGVCDACQAIDDGRFIDLIEVDAASKTKVDDTREMLDNVQFAPTQGRYKVYLIDEVHMLSKSSFNALLKTLEEPPEHVKFLLATTDPHKLPATVLSRCLQFNLMRLTEPQLQAHLAFILDSEKISYEPAALNLLAKSADGSARDSLSLLDQAIAYGAGEVMFEAVQTMLGLVDQQFGESILNALANDSAAQLKDVIQQLALMGVDYQALLAQLIETLHELTYYQVLGAGESSTLNQAFIEDFAQRLAPERVQMLYQIALLARQDMLLAPDIRIGFEMALMRMLAFQPVNESTGMHTQPLAEASDSQTSVKKPYASSIQQTSEQGGQSQLNPEPTAFAAEAGPDPEEVLASMSSARSLMANAEHSPVHNHAEKQSENSTSVEETTLDAQHRVQKNPSEVPTQTEYAPQEPSGLSGNDHLTQIKERLKQPLGKPPSTPASSGFDNAQVTAATPSRDNTVRKVQLNTASENTLQPPPEVLQADEHNVPPWDNSTATSVESSSDRLVTGPLNFKLSGDLCQDWLDLIDFLDLSGMATELAKNSVLVSLDNKNLCLSIDPEVTFAKPEMATQQIQNAIWQKLGQNITLKFQQASAHDTPMKKTQQDQANQQNKAVQAIHNDEKLAQLRAALDMELIASSIKPI